MIRRTFQASVTPVNDRQLRAVLATEELGRDNLVIRLAGVQAPDSMVGLFNHDPALPVCRWTELGGVRYGAPALATFPAVGTSEKADEVCRLAKQGTLDAVSIGFEPVEVEPADPKTYPRGAKIVTRCELLECSWVSVPADRGARVVERKYISHEAAASLTRAREAVEAAETHCQTVGHCIKRGLDDDAATAHAHCGRCINIAQRCFRAVGSYSTPAIRRAAREIDDAERYHVELGEALGEDDQETTAAHRRLSRSLGRARGHLRTAATEAMLEDGANNYFSQNSAPGLTLGTSDRGRASLSFYQRQIALRALAPRPPAPVGGAVGVTSLRDFEFQRAQTHIEACARAGAFSRPLSRAERQRAAEALRRI
jgi:HK97 family phage prohead protease